MDIKNKSIVIMQIDGRVIVDQHIKTILVQWPAGGPTFARQGIVRYDPAEEIDGKRGLVAGCLLDEFVHRIERIDKAVLNISDGRWRVFRIIYVIKQHHCKLFFPRASVGDIACRSEARDRRMKTTRQRVLMDSTFVIKRILPEKSASEI